MTTDVRPTLRTLSGAPAEPIALRDSALILIDCQQTYREGVMLLDGVEPALDECRDILLRARAAGIPIFHIMHDAGAGSPSTRRRPSARSLRPSRRCRANRWWSRIIRIRSKRPISTRC